MQSNKENVIVDISFEFAKNYPKSEKLLNDIEPIIKILSKIITTSKGKK